MSNPLLDRALRVRAGILQAGDEVSDRRINLFASAIDDFDAVPHRVLGRRRRNDDLIRMERGSPPRSERAEVEVSQLALGHKIRTTKLGQCVIQPGLGDGGGCFRDVKWPMGGCRTRLNGAFRDNDKIFAITVWIEPAERVDEFPSPTGWSTQQDPVWW